MPVTARTIDQVREYYVRVLQSGRDLKANACCPTDSLPPHFQLDDHHFFETGRPVLVCGNTASMLENTRYSKHFKVKGNRSSHFGPFDCATASSSLGDKETGVPGGACC